MALLLFIVVERRASNPLLELRDFRSPDFSPAIVAQWVGQIALFGSLFLVPLFLQQARGYGAFDTGLILLPQAIAAGLFMPLGGVLFDRIGARPLVMIGLAIVAVATFLLSQLGVTTHGSDLIVPLALAGAGMGLMMMPLNTHLLNAAPRVLVGRVTPLTNALQQVVNSLSIAGLATIPTARAATHSAEVRATLARHVHGSAGAPSRVLPPRLAHQIAAAFNQAFVSAFDDTFKYMVVAAIIGAAMGLVLRRRPRAQAEAAGAGQSGAAVSTAHTVVGG